MAIKSSFQNTDGRVFNPNSKDFRILRMTSHLIPIRDGAKPVAVSFLLNELKPQALAMYSRQPIREFEKIKILLASGVIATGVVRACNLDSSSSGIPRYRILAEFTFENEEAQQNLDKLVAKVNRSICTPGGDASDGFKIVEKSTDGSDFDIGAFEDYNPLDTDAEEAAAGSVSGTEAPAASAKDSGSEEKSAQSENEDEDDLVKALEGLSSKVDDEAA